MGVALRLWREQKGQALVELALLLPVLLLLLGGIMEFGRLLHAQLVLTAASREGARAAAVGLPPEEVCGRVREVAAALDEDRLEVVQEPAGGLARGQLVTVTVRYTLDLVFPFMEALLPVPFPLRASTTMRVE